MAKFIQWGQGCSLQTIDYMERIRPLISLPSAVLIYWGYSYACYRKDSIVSLLNPAWGKTSNFGTPICRWKGSIANPPSMLGKRHSRQLKYPLTQRSTPPPPNFASWIAVDPVESRAVRFEIGVELPVKAHSRFLALH